MIMNKAKMITGIGNECNDSNIPATQDYIKYVIQIIKNIM